MDTVDYLRDQRGRPIVAFQEFCSEYKKFNPMVCYAFVEGAQDRPYYQTVVKHKIPSDCEVMWYCSGGKGSVRTIYERLRNRKYPKERIVYFMDRDLSLVLDDPDLLEDNYVYITNGYSIENDILNAEAFLYAVEYLSGFSALPLEGRQFVCNSYEVQKRRFEDMMIPLMANIIVWTRDGVKVSYGNLNIKGIISVKNEQIQFHGDVQDAIKLQCEQLKMKIPDSATVESVIREISDKGLSGLILRGKYLVEFFCIFSTWLCEYLVTKFPTSRRGKQIPFSKDNLMQVLGPACGSSDSLNDFLSKTLLAYFDAVRKSSS